MKTLKKINDAIYYFEKLVLSLSILGVFLILIVNVFTRFVLNNGISWAEEIGSLLITFICFIGLSYAARTGRHIIMSAVYDNVSIKIQKIVTTVVDFLAIFALLYLGKMGFDYVMTVKGMNRLSPTLLFPLWIPYLVIPLGFYMAALQYFILFMMNLKTSDIVRFIIREPDSDLDDSEDSGFSFDVTGENTKKEVGNQ